MTQFIIGVSAKTQVDPEYQDYLKDTWEQLSSRVKRCHVSGIQPEESSCNSGDGIILHPNGFCPCKM